MTCNYNIKDAIYYLDKLNRKEATGYYTIASYETLDPENYDFPNLMEALEWVKQVGGIIHSQNGIMFTLADGSHAWNQSEILKQGLSNLAQDSAISFFSNVAFTLKGGGSGNTTIKVDAPLGLEDITLFNADMGFQNLRIKILGTNQNEMINIKGTNSGLFVQNCVLDDVFLMAHSRSEFIVIGANEFRNNNNVNKDALMALYSSFIDCTGANFNNSDFNVSADVDSKILFRQNVNTGSLVLSPAINTRSATDGQIFDGTVIVA